MIDITGRNGLDNKKPWENGGHHDVVFGDEAVDSGRIFRNCVRLVFAEENHQIAKTGHSSVTIILGSIQLNWIFFTIEEFLKFFCQIVIFVVFVNVFIQLIELKPALM